MARSEKQRKQDMELQRKATELHQKNCSPEQLARDEYLISQSTMAFQKDKDAAQKKGWKNRRDQRFGS